MVGERDDGDDSELVARIGLAKVRECACADIEDCDVGFAHPLQGADYEWAPKHGVGVRPVHITLVSLHCEVVVPPGHFVQDSAFPNLVRRPDPSACRAEQWSHSLPERTQPVPRSHADASGWRTRCDQTL